MKLIELLRLGREELKKAGVYNADGEALMILKHVYDIEDHDWPIKSSQEQKDSTQYLKLIERRQSGEPLQYIMGYAYFYGRKFKVQKGVLIPRFDTEVLAYEAIKEAKALRGANVLDMCAGSGCVGLTVALEEKDTAVTLADIDEGCINTIKENAECLGAENITIVNSNLFLCIKGLFDIITINPPYISSKEYNDLEREVVDFEPKLALYGGEDGLAFYRRIANNVYEHLSEGGLLLMEIGFDQAEAVTKLFEDDRFTDLKTIEDLTGNDRVIYVRKNLRSREENI